MNKKNRCRNGTNASTPSAIASREPMAADFRNLMRRRLFHIARPISVNKRTRPVGYAFLPSLGTCVSLRRYPGHTPWAKVLRPCGADLVTGCGRMDRIGVPIELALSERQRSNGDGRKAGSSTVKIIRERMIFFARNDSVELWVGMTWALPPWSCVSEDVLRHLTPRLQPWIVDRLSD